MSHTPALPETIEDLFGLRGKIAVVVGGGLGHGEACAKWLALAGCDVAIVDILPERAARVAGDIRAMGRRAVEVVIDGLDPRQVEKAFPKLETELGPIDVMVTIIGEAGWYSFLETSLEAWDYDQLRNLKYFFHCSQWAARSMVARGSGGAICAISSVDGLQASPMHGAYGAAKAGIVSLVKTMAAELGHHGIRVNAVAPGTIKTPRAVARSTPEKVDATARDLGIPLGRSGTTEEVAQAILYLCSDMARYVTGVTLPVDGGWLSTRLDITRYKKT